MNGYETWEMVEFRRQERMRDVKMRNLARLARQSPCPDRPRRIVRLLSGIAQALTAHNRSTPVREIIPVTVKGEC
ncbi:MAG: hypothetical protein IPK19_29290 [Chloroflexi bacterium]|nr:hypothetical protein [Chloroflexota bacterium]